MVCNTLDLALCEAYLLGTKVGAQDFCKDALLAMVKTFVERSVSPGPTAFNKAYEKTPGPCLLVVIPALTSYTHLSYIA